MPYSFGAEPKVYKTMVDDFRGVDFASSEVKIAPNRSPNAVNIISDLAGKPQKRTGYKTVLTSSGNVNGIHRLKTADSETVWVHIDTTLYEWNMTAGELDETAGVDNDVLTQVRTGLNDYRSVSYQYGGKLYILDGLKLLVCGDLADNGIITVDAVENQAYVPTVLIGASPALPTGGTVSGGLNLLTPLRTVGYIVPTSYQMPSYMSDNGGTSTGNPRKSFNLPTACTNTASVKIEYLYPNGTWFDPTAVNMYTNSMISEGTWAAVESISVSGSSVSVTNGWYYTYSGDNVRITYEGSVGDGSDINKSTVACLYGVGGNTNHLFLGGNADMPNILYWSGFDSETNLPDMSYIPADNMKLIGQDSSMIMGFNKVGSELVIHKENNGQDENVFLLSGGLDGDGKEVFSVKTGIAGSGAASRWGNSEFFGEPVFISPNGLEAITTLSVTSERYAQNRSYYVRPQLAAMDLSEAVGIAYNGYYYLSVGNKCFVADSKRKVYAQNAPQSDYQYEWYYFENVPARVWWEHDGRLYFGTADGKVKRFYKADEYENSTTDYVYKDDETAITAVWDTPYFHFDTLGNYKNLKGLWVMLAPNIRSGIDILYRSRGSLSNVKAQSVSTNNADIFDFNDVDFTRFTFNIDTSPMVIATNRKLKKFMTVQFRFKNANAEPFCLYGFEARYTISSKFKG